MNTYIEIAQNWLAQDPDPETHAELTALLNNPKALEERFGKRLEFGTAGLRADLRAGMNGMNRVVVAQSAAGIAAYLKKNFANPSIIIGYDARKKGNQFARDSAEIMQGAGIKTYLLPEALPTPLLASTAKAMKTSAAIMVTASHNPPEYQGYKVYVENVQIIAPTDAEIAKEIDLAAQTDIREYPRSSDYQILDDQPFHDYVAATAKVLTEPTAPLNFVYTAMHGVGKKTLLATLKAAGLNEPHLVAEQVEPDAAFPTVAFPNPEEEGALDLAFKLADEKNAEFIIANDPDADRLAVAIKTENGWKRLHGNDIGLLLAWEAAQSGKKGTLANSLVSSPLLKKIAEEYGLKYVSTLTGFKYIGRVENLLFGYEEALGYLVDQDKVQDKDGISAAMGFLNLALKLKAQGKTLAGYLKEFAEKFGTSLSDQISVRFENIADIKKSMQDLRDNLPTHFATYEVRQIKDYLPENNENILQFTLDNARIIYRPSGTEPKLKIYLDVFADDLATAQKIMTEIKKQISK